MNENGKLFARVNQHIDIDFNNSEDKPSGKVQTEVEVPSKGIHKNIIQNLPAEYQTFTDTINRRSASDSFSESGNNVSRALFSHLLS